MKVRWGDITGYDDAELLELYEDTPDDSDLVIDTEEEEKE